MNRDRIWAFVLGVLSLLPLLALIYISFMIFLPLIMGVAPYSPAESDEAFVRFLAATLTLGVFSLFLTAYFMIFIFRSALIPAEYKAFWAVALFMGNAVVFPIFWYLYFWKHTHRS